MTRWAAAMSILTMLAAGEARLKWTDRSPMPRAVAGGYVSAIGTSVIYAGGATWVDGVKRWLRDVNLFDAEANRWEPGPALPVPLAYGVVQQVNGGVEIYGGSDGARTYRECWRWERGKKSWEPAGMLPSDSLLGAAVSVAGKVYLLGGCPDIVDLTHCSNSVNVRESDGAWRKFSNMPAEGLSNSAAVAVGGRVYLFGGCAMPAPKKLINGDGAYVLDIRSGKWRTLRPLPRPNRGLNAVVLDERRILISGGYTASEAEAAGKTADFGFTSEALIYDIETGEYRATTPLPFAVAGADTIAIHGAVFAFGGEDRMRGRSARVLMGAF